MKILNKINSSKVTFIVLLLIVLSFTKLNLQSQTHHDRSFNPDSLIQINITGVVVVDSSFVHPMYFLDETNDGTPEYILNFGPYWYEPDEGQAARPSNGETISIFGGLHDALDSLDVIVVYEINGKFWREAYEPIWYNMGNHMHVGGHHDGNCQGYAFGFDHDTLINITIEGITLVDTTFIMGSYYLDQNGDSLPDYFLNFGPPWYEPSNGVQRPMNGDKVNIVGGLINYDSIPMIIVYSLNGIVWRDSNSIGEHLGGDWAHRNMNDSVFIHSLFDNKDWMTVKPGWYNGGGMHGGGTMTDSLFFQMLEVYPQNIPFTERENVFAGYEFGVFLPDGQNNMWNGGGCGGMMNFNSSIDFNLHFNEKQINGLNLSGKNIQVKYWDPQSNNWQEITDAAVSLTTGTVNFNLNTASNYVILTSSTVTAVENSVGNNLIVEYELMQNYPNPFNPATSINYKLPNAGFVSLKVYDVLGREVSVLVNQFQQAGNYNVSFNAAKLASGIYFYKLHSGSFVSVRKMMLIE